MADFTWADGTGSLYVTGTGLAAPSIVTFASVARSTAPDCCGSTADAERCEVDDSRQPS